MLLVASLIVALLSLTGIITVSYQFDNVKIFVMFFIGGELLFILMLTMSNRHYYAENT